MAPRGVFGTTLVAFFLAGPDASYMTGQNLVVDGVANAAASMDAAGLARVYEHGATKYALNNWRAGQSWTRCAAALMRHVSRWLMGETRDPESGQNHLLHAAFWCFALYEWSLNPDHQKDDDRWIDPLLAKEAATHTTAEKQAKKRDK